MTRLLLYRDCIPLSAATPCSCDNDPSGGIEAVGHRSQPTASSAAPILLLTSDYIFLGRTGVQTEVLRECAEETV